MMKSCKNFRLKLENDTQASPLTFENTFFCPLSNYLKKIIEIYFAWHQLIRVK